MSNIDLDEILEDLHVEVNGNEVWIAPVDIIEAKASIEQWHKQKALKLLPKKRDKTIKTYKDFDFDNPRHRYVHGVDVGWNKAVDTFIDNIGEGLS